MPIHELKNVQPHFDAVARGEKRAEIRFDDRGFAAGDVLVRDAEPGTWSAVVAVALACEVADRAEARQGDPRQLELFDGDEE
jgi:hypothetical protein